MERPIQTKAPAKELICAVSRKRLRLFTYLLTQKSNERRYHYVQTKTTSGNIYPTGLVAKAKEMDLLSYLQQYEPQEAVRLSRRVYTTKTHDSLKISNGMWMWWSHGIGGKTALEYLIKVKGLPFTEAVMTILQEPDSSLRLLNHKIVSETERSFVLPKAAASNEIATGYLMRRGIAPEVIDHCVKSGLLYESKRGHNVVFVGCDECGMPRYAGLRSTGSNTFKVDVEGSEKAFAFRLVNKDSTELHVFEGPIDLLSYATLMQLENKDWQNTNLLSLAGVFGNAKQRTDAKLPAALTQFLHDHPQVKTIHLHLDRDAAGRNAAELLLSLLSEKYTVINAPPPSGSKDINDYLCRSLCLPIQTKGEGRDAR